MSALLGLAMTVGAAASLSCLALGHERRSVSAWVGSLAMATAMLDTMLTRLLPAVAWALVLVVTAMGTVGGRTPWALHRAIGLIVMTPALLLMRHGDVASPASSAHAHGGMLTAFVVLAGVGFVGYSIRLAVSTVAGAPEARQRWSRLEVLIGGPLVASMSLGAALGPFH